MSLTDRDGSGTVPYKPGDSGHFRITLTNNGPGDAPGINAVVDMPPTFHYKSTDAIDDSGSARTQPLDARVGTSSPQWGFWDIAAPSATGTSSVTIDFTALVDGSPNTYNLLAHAVGDNTAGTIVAKPVVVQIIPAARLQITADAHDPTLNIGDTETYSVTVANTGSATATGVSLLIALPQVMVFVDSVLPFGGNASQSESTAPLRGAIELYYGTFTVPAASSAGPGLLVVTFKAQVVGRAPSGAYVLNGQAIDDSGDIVHLNNAAAVMVTGIGGSPTP